MHGDICDEVKVASVLADRGVDAIVHFAAESHVDRSILSPGERDRHELRGTATLLAAARAANIGRFLHVSTDEVYGDIDEPFEADETFPLKPSSPYAASKAASDLLALCVRPHLPSPGRGHSRVEQLRSLSIPGKAHSADDFERADRVPLPVYGDGLQVRDWLYVDDHCRALLAVLERGGKARSTTWREPVT